jgi:hypothetical protein
MADHGLSYSRVADYARWALSEATGYVFVKRPSSVQRNVRLNIMGVIKNTMADRSRSAIHKA